MAEAAVLRLPRTRRRRRRRPDPWDWLRRVQEAAVVIFAAAAVKHALSGDVVGTVRDALVVLECGIGAWWRPVTTTVLTIQTAVLALLIGLGAYGV